MVFKQHFQHVTLENVILRRLISSVEKVRIGNIGFCWLGQLVPDITVLSITGNDTCKQICQVDFVCVCSVQEFYNTRIVPYL